MAIINGKSTINGIVVGYDNGYPLVMSNIAIENGDW